MLADLLEDGPAVDPAAMRRLLGGISRLVDDSPAVSRETLARTLLACGSALAVDCVGPDRTARLCEDLAWQSRSGALAWEPIGDEAAIKRVLLEVCVEARRGGVPSSVEDVNGALAERGLLPVSCETIRRLAPTAPEIDALVKARFDSDADD